MMTAGRLVVTTLSFFLLPTSTTVLALAPPHPDFVEDFVRQQEQHPASRKRNLQFLRSSSKHDEPSQASSSRWQKKFNARLFDGARCKDSHHDCQQVVDNSHINNKSPQNLGRNSDLTLKLIQETGKLRPLILLMQFPDHQFRELPTRADIDKLWNSKKESTDDPGSIKQYLEHNSYGNLEVHATVVDWITTDQNEAFYAAGVSGLRAGLEVSIYPLLDQLDRQGFDFSRNDDNGDKIIDNIMVLHSGYSAEIGGHDCYNGAGFEHRIWSHAVPSMSNEWRSQEGYRFTQYTVSSAMSGLCNADIAATGTMIHELMHAFGVPDLYDVSGEWIGRGTGLYSIMSNPHGWTSEKLQPPSLDPFSRMELGWVNPIPISANGKYTIEASALAPQVYMLQAGFPDGEFLLIENRQQLDYDESMEGSGLLIWHIDKAKSRNDERGYPGQAGWPGNGRHYRVALLQADRKYDLETGENGGDAGDFWTKGSELRVGPETNEAIDLLVYPNTNSYMNGNIVQTGIRVYDISESGPIMSFRISGIIDSPDPPTSQPSLTPSSKPSMKTSGVPSLTPSVTTTQPSLRKSATPSAEPTAAPTRTESARPSGLPTPNPSSSPSNLPTLFSTLKPSVESSSSPSLQPVTSFPSRNPSQNPTTLTPSRAASKLPTLSRRPSGVPSATPSSYPSEVTSAAPTIAPSSKPSAVASAAPTITPSSKPSAVASAAPTNTPSGKPSAVASAAPTIYPSGKPSAVASAAPTIYPSGKPSAAASAVPTTIPSNRPISVIYAVPIITQSRGPKTGVPTVTPVQKLSPSSTPSAVPSAIHTLAPTSLKRVDVQSQLPSQSPVEAAVLFDTKLLTVTRGVPSTSPTKFPHPSSNKPTEEQLVPSEKPSESSNSNTISPTEFPSTVVSFGFNNALHSASKRAGK